jgi:hypothetical protein
MARSSGRDTLLRLSAALLATVPLAFYVSLALTAFLPASDQVRAAVGFFSPLPLYSLFACLLARMHTGGRAWLSCLVPTLMLKLLLALH